MPDKSLTTSTADDSRPTSNHKHSRGLGLVQAVGGDAGVGAGVSDDGARDGEGVILEAVSYTHLRAHET